MAKGKASPSRGASAGKGRSSIGKGGSVQTAPTGPLATVPRGSGSTDGGGWAVGGPNAQQAGGSWPAVNPFLLPKSAGLNVISQTYPNNYYREWDTSSWREACDRVIRQGWTVDYATLVTWCYQSSPFVQSLFRTIEAAIGSIPIYFEDKNGKKLDDWTKELCEKPWQQELKKQIAFSFFWGFVGMNFDPVKGKLYKYPMQEIDPLNRMLRGSTYDFWNGTYFEESPSLLFVQPSTADESFLGWMQGITRLFIMMNENDSNWVAAGRKLAFPIFMVGYPAGNNDLDPATGGITNPYKAEAEHIARTVGPGQAAVFPFTRSTDGEIQKNVEIEFEQTGASQKAHSIYQDFNETKKNEIREQIMGGTLTADVGNSGSRALGEVQERKLHMFLKPINEFVIACHNDEYLRKISQYYTNFPKGGRFNYNRSKQLSIEEIVAWADILQGSGKRFTTQFFESYGLPAEYIEDAPTPAGGGEDEGAQPLSKKNDGRITPLSTKKKNYSIDRYTLAAGKKDKSNRSPIIPADLSEEEKEYIYQEPNGDLIFTPVYELYNDTLLSGIIKSISIESEFNSFRETGWFEKYMTNTYQFSAAKNYDEVKKIQALVYGPDGKLQSWAKFRNAADEIQVTFQKTWLRVERDNAARQAVLADKFKVFRENADLYPYWIYQTRKDSRVRPEHRYLEGLIFRIGDPNGDACFPPSDWNCRCTGKNLDDTELKGRTVLSNKEAGKWLKGNDPEGNPYIDKQFRYNPADQGMLPKIGDYFHDFKNANAGNADLFRLGGKNNPEGMSASRFPDVVNIMDDWRRDYHVDKIGNIVFQNKQLLANIVYTTHSAHTIGHHVRGVEMLPETLIHPTEVWSRWENTEDQQIVLRNYLQFSEKTAYIVQTRDGAVQDGFLMSRNQAEKYRTGVVWRNKGK